MEISWVTETKRALRAIEEAKVSEFERFVLSDIDWLNLYYANIQTSLQRKDDLASTLLKTPSLRGKKGQRPRAKDVLFGPDADHTADNLISSSNTLPSDVEMQLTDAIPLTRSATAPVALPSQRPTRSQATSQRHIPSKAHKIAAEQQVHHQPPPPFPKQPQSPKEAPVKSAALDKENVGASSPKKHIAVQTLPEAQTSTPSLPSPSKYSDNVTVLSSEKQQQQQQLSQKPTDTRSLKSITQIRDLKAKGPLSVETLPSDSQKRLSDESLHSPAKRQKGDTDAGESGSGNSAGKLAQVQRQKEESDPANFNSLKRAINQLPSRTAVAAAPLPSPVKSGTLKDMSARLTANSPLRHLAPAPSVTLPSVSSFSATETATTSVCQGLTITDLQNKAKPSQPIAGSASFVPVQPTPASVASMPPITDLEGRNEPKKSTEALHELDQLAREAQKFSEFLKHDRTAPRRETIAAPSTPPSQVFRSIAPQLAAAAKPATPVAVISSAKIAMAQAVAASPELVGRGDFDDSDFLDISKVDNHLMATGSPDTRTKSVASHIFASPPPSQAKPVLVTDARPDKTISVTTETDSVDELAPAEQNGESMATSSASSHVTERLEEDKRVRPTKVLTALEKKQKMEQERLERIRLQEEEKRRRAELVQQRKQKEEEEKRRRQEENKQKFTDKHKLAKDKEQNRIQMILQKTGNPFFPVPVLSNPKDDPLFDLVAAPASTTSKPPPAASTATAAPPIAASTAEEPRLPAAAPTVAEQKIVPKKQELFAVQVPWVDPQEALRLAPVVAPPVSSPIQAKTAAVPTQKEQMQSENYDIHHYSEGDSTDEEDDPKQTVPRWARKDALLAALTKQLQSPRTIFGEIPAYNKMDIFGEGK